MSVVNLSVAIFAPYVKAFFWMSGSLSFYIVYEYS